MERYSDLIKSLRLDSEQCILNAYERNCFDHIHVDVLFRIAAKISISPWLLVAVIHGKSAEKNEQSMMPSSFN